MFSNSLKAHNCLIWGLPSKIFKVTEDDSESSAMKKSFQSYKWTDTHDVMIYPWEDVIGHIDAPKHTSKRLFYAVSDLEKLILF